MTAFGGEKAMQPPNNAEFVPPHELALQASEKDDPAELGDRFEA
jgi:hypothetical protein